MRIAIIGDTHFGYTRFEEDSHKQGESALLDASEKADIILLAGDVFHTKIPKFETIQRVINTLKKIKIPIIAIHGNHERRSTDMINTLQLLNSGELINYIHNGNYSNEKVNIVGLGSIPSNYVKEGLEKCLEKNKIQEGKFNILMIHQDIEELSVQGEISFDDLRELPFDLIVNGHIHKYSIELDGKLVIPGSTVVTQLKKEETKPRGYILYNIEDKKAEFVEIPHRKFIMEVIEFKDTGINEVKEKVKERIKELNVGDPIIRIKITGTLKQGLTHGDLTFPQTEKIFVDNELDSKSLKEKLIKIRELRENRMSVREVAMKKLDTELKGKVSFDPTEFFNKLLSGVDDALEYLKVN